MSYSNSKAASHTYDVTSNPHTSELYHYNVTQYNTIQTDSVCGQKVNHFQAFLKLFIVPHIFIKSLCFAGLVTSLLDVLSSFRYSEIYACSHIFPQSRRTWFQILEVVINEVTGRRCCCDSVGCLFISTRGTNVTGHLTKMLNNRQTPSCPD